MICTLGRYILLGSLWNGSTSLHRYRRTRHPSTFTLLVRFKRTKRTTSLYVYPFLLLHLFNTMGLIVFHTFTFFFPKSKMLVLRKMLSFLRAPTHYGKPNWDHFFPSIVEKLEHPETDVGVVGSVLFYLLG